jgi:glutamate-ammonia-ligase adenylyltransferase
VVGPADVAQRFETVRQQVMSAPRDPMSLQAEILSMRDKVRQAHAVKGEWFDVKHSPGGMVDIEFVVQYLLLLHTGRHPDLLANSGNIALLQRAEQLGLLKAPLGVEAANAYRALRQLQHRARLDEAHGQTDMALIEPWRDAGLRLWKAVMQP